MKQFKLFLVIFTLFLISVSISYGSSYQATTDLTIRAVINTVEAGDVDAVWKKGGEETTSGGDRVIWGYFYASPSDVNWGSENNPDLYVKIWFDRSGRIDVNFFHVSVPDIEVYSEYSGNGTSNQYNKNTMENRYYRHEYNSDTTSIVGTWVRTSYSGDSDGPEWTTFNSDGTYTDNNQAFSSSYLVSGNNISGSHVESDGTVTWNGTISGTTIYINWSHSNGYSGSITLVKQ
ncbi:MAG: hypothetical protein K8S13_11680 [Desulfobacula sp.]|uniref:hypothetical protein n=1 Tax=Desulfobacula sp. TaxID=2593537 RepID=UPI0025C33CD1|nr:hypothetical protein [Desulfobacula sp.]MCD4720501.1 hypothetical protein [Desulfobacula sp.]